MKIVGVAAAVLAFAAAPASAGGDQYKPDRYVARYCSQTGDICFGIFRANGIVFQLLTIERYFTSYTICVRSPRGSRTCRSMPVNRQGRLWGSYKRWPRHFGDRRPGVYRVTWKHSGRPLGPTLRFTQR